jgi:DNA primase
VDFEIDPSPYAKGNIKNGKQTVGVRKDKDTVYNLCNAAKEYSEMLGSEDSFLLYNLVGKDEKGRLTFPYFDDNGDVIAIKHHKGKNGEAPYWHKGGDNRAKWYNGWNLPVYKRHKSLIISEGEPDTIKLCRNGFQSICSSHGTITVPELIPIMKEWK